MTDKIPALDLCDLMVDEIDTAITALEQHLKGEG